MPEQAAATNGYDPDIVSSLVSRLEALHGDLESERGQYMQRCRTIRDDIKDVLQAAADEDGIPKKALKAIIRERQLLAKIDDLVGGLEAEDSDGFERLKLALGDLDDTPLGNAAKLAANMDADARRGRGRKRSEPEAEAVA